MGIKINLSKLQQNESSKTKSSSLNLNKLLSASKTIGTETSDVSAASINLNNIKTNETGTKNTDPTILNSTKLTSAQTAAPAFSLTFTEGQVYDLDDIIFATRRDNENCPLIVHYNDQNKNDVEVVKTITKLILDDYGVKYDNAYDDDESNEMCYKNRVSLVPGFYSIFTIYYNKYYAIYYARLNSDHLLGSISLSTVLENIQTTHENYYKELITTTSVTAYNNTGVFNKPQVDIEYGTIPKEYDDSEIDNTGSLFADKFSLKLENGYLQIYYDGQPINESGVFLQAESKYKDSIDLSECEHVSVYRDVKLDLYNETECKIETNDYLVDAEMEPLKLITVDSVVDISKYTCFTVSQDLDMNISHDELCLFSSTDHVVA